MYSSDVGWTEKTIKRGSTTFKTLGNNVELSSIVLLHVRFVFLIEVITSYPKCLFVQEKLQKLEKQKLEKEVKAQQLIEVS